MIREFQSSFRLLKFDLSSTRTRELILIVIYLSKKISIQETTKPLLFLWRSSKLKERISRSKTSNGLMLIVFLSTWLLYANEIGRVRFWLFEIDDF